MSKLSLLLGQGPDAVDAMPLERSHAILLYAHAEREAKQGNAAKRELDRDYDEDGITMSRAPMQMPD